MLQIHYIRISCARYFLFLLVGFALAALAACSNGAPPPDDEDSSSSKGNSSNASSSSGGGNPSNASSSSGGGNSSNASSSSVGIVDGEWPFDLSGEELQASPGLDELNLSNVISITYNNGTVEINNPYDTEVSANATGGDVVVNINNSSTNEYNFVLSGTTSNGSIKFYGDVKKGLYLNGVNITNSRGPAINIQKSKRITVHLINGTQNFLADGPVYSGIPNGEDAKGTFFSEGKLEFEGSGSLEVKAKLKHAIAVDDVFEMNNGKIIVSEAVNDGIHANEKIKVKGGFLKITSTGDAIQNEADSIRVTGGKIKATTTGAKSHGIVSEGPISISDNAIIQISVLGNGSKGIKSREVGEFKGGKTSIKVSGTKHTDSADPEDESTPTGIKLTGDLNILSGELTVKSPGSEAKGVNTEGNATIKNGKVDIDADGDAMKVHGNLRIEGGAITLNSKNKKAIDATSCTKTGGSINVQCGDF